MPLFKDQDSGVEKIFEGLPKNVKEELGGFSKIDLLDLNKDDCINICESKAQGIRLYYRIKRIISVSSQAKLQQEAQQIQETLNENALFFNGNGNDNEGERTKEEDRKEDINESQSANGGGGVEAEESARLDRISSTNDQKGPYGMEHKVELTLNVDKFSEVRNMKTYLYVNGHRSNSVFRVSRRTKDTVVYDGKTEGFQELGLLVSFSRNDGLAQVRKKVIGDAPLYICGKITLWSNRPIGTVNILDKNGSAFKEKNYPAKLYPPSTSSSSSSSSTSSSSSSSKLTPVDKLRTKGKDLRDEESEKKCQLEFGIKLKMTKNDAEVYCERLSEALKLMKEVFAVIPREYRDEKTDTISRQMIADNSKNETLVAVSLKLMKAKYSVSNVAKVLQRTLNLWDGTTQLPHGVYKGGSPVVTKGCIKITQFFKMGAVAKASEMLKWIFNEEKHLMSTLTFNGEAVSELDIEYFSPDQSNKLGIPNKVWFVFPNVTEQLSQRVNSFLQEHPFLEQQPYRHESFPDIELQQIKISSMTKALRPGGGDTSISMSKPEFQMRDCNHMGHDEAQMNLDDSKDESYDRSTSIGLSTSAAINSTATVTDVTMLASSFNR
eukprot:jgi/Bigna1/83897/fgenesh1_pg.118_\